LVDSLDFRPASFLLYLLMLQEWAVRQFWPALTAGTVMALSHTPLRIWFWAAYLVTSQTPGMSATQLQRQLGMSRYETVFQILHKLRAGMVRPDQDRIGGRRGEHVEVDEALIGGRTRGKGRGVHDKVLVACAVEVRQRRPGTKRETRKGGRYAGRVRLAVVPDRSAASLCGFVECAVVPGTSLVTDDWSSYASLAKRGYQHMAVAERGDPQMAEQDLPIIHLVFANLKTWLNGIHHGVSHQHLQAYLNEFTFRFNRRFYPFNPHLSQDCSFQGTAFALRIDTLMRLNRRSGAIPGSMDCR
jgi:transposase-like protein